MSHQGHRAIAAAGERGGRRQLRRQGAQHRGGGRASAEIRREFPGQRRGQARRRGAQEARRRPAPPPRGLRGAEWPTPKAIAEGMATRAAAEPPQRSLSACRRRGFP